MKKSPSIEDDFLILFLGIIKAIIHKTIMVQNDQPITPCGRLCAIQGVICQNLPFIINTITVAIKIIVVILAKILKNFFT